MIEFIVERVDTDSGSRDRLPERFVEFMGTRLGPQSPEGAEDQVRLGLAAANCLIGSFGIGAGGVADIEERRAALKAYALPAEICEPWIQEEFLEELMGNETYQLCANF